MINRGHLTCVSRLLHSFPRPLQTKCDICPEAEKKLVFRLLYFYTFPTNRPYDSSVKWYFLLNYFVFFMTWSQFSAVVLLCGYFLYDIYMFLSYRV